KLLFFASNLLFFIANCASAQEAKPPQSPPPPPPPLVSPDVQADHRVTFRLRAPNAREVTVSLEGNPEPIVMQKDEQGVWTATSDALAPDFYGYSFHVDGVNISDPSNYRIKPNFLSRASELHVPGDASLSWETADVPHGEIRHHFYKSAVVGDQRDY